MPAYVVALIERITDPESYKEYVAQVEATLVPFGGRFLARRPDPALLEGEGAPSRAVVLAFPDEAQARAWHASPAYQPVMKLRQRASVGKLLLLPGHAAPRVPVGEVCYLEMVVEDVDAARKLQEAVHGWRFAAPDPALGGSLVATLPSGVRCSLRARMHEQERLVTRAYVRVEDVERAAQRAQEQGAMLALAPMALEGHGRIAIWFHGGVEHGAWELA